MTFTLLTNVDLPDEKPSERERTRAAEFRLLRSQESWQQLKNGANFRPLLTTPPARRLADDCSGAQRISLIGMQAFKSRYSLIVFSMRE